jgi:hypothetical protein
MPELTVRCPACKVGLRLKKMPEGKAWFPCPKCGARVPLKQPKEEVIPTVEAVEDDEELEEVRPAARRRPRDEDEDVEEKPARRQRRRDDEEDDQPDDRPRRKKRKKGPAARPYLWPVAGGSCLVGVAVVFLVLYGIMGGQGFPPPQDGPPILKPIVLAVFLAVGAGIMVNGCYGIVYQKITVARRALFVVWEEQYEGTWAVLVGIGQCIAGAIAAGAGLYGLVM